MLRGRFIVMVMSCLSLMVGIGSTVATPEVPNLILDPDFEAVPVGEKPERWELWERQRGDATWGVDDSVAFSGCKALHISNKGTKDWSAHYPGLPGPGREALDIKAGEKLYLSVAIRVTGASAWGALDVAQYDETGKVTYQYPRTRVSGNSEWKVVEDTVTIAPGTVSVRIRLSGGGLGDVWFDAVTVKRLDKESAVSLIARSSKPVLDYEVPIENLTPGPGEDYHCYFTHPAFTPDGRYVWYQSIRDGMVNLYLRDLQSGEERLLPGTGGIGAGAAALNRSGSKLFFVRGNVLNSIDFPNGEEAVGVCRFDEKWTKISQPTFCRSDDRVFVAAQDRQSSRWSILAVDVNSGKVDVVGTFDFYVNHLQGCPADDRTLLFCDQKGDWCVPQRMWLVDTDGTNLRPLYKQRPEDWVTHEMWSADGSFVSFVLHPIGLGLIGRDNTGFRVISPAEGDPDNLLPPEVKALRATAVREDYPDPDVTTDRFGVGGAYSRAASWPVIWHAATSPDGLWAVADTHASDILLIHLPSGRIARIARRQMTNSKYHPHPGFAPDGTHVYWARSDARGVRVVWADVRKVMEQLAGSENEQ